MISRIVVYYLHSTPPVVPARHSKSPFSIDKEAPNPGLIRIERDPGASVADWVWEAAANAERLKAPVSRRWIQPILSGNFTDGMETVGAPERAASAALAANVSFAAANAGIGKCVDYGWRGRRRRSYSSTSKKIRVLV